METQLPVNENQLFYKHALVCDIVLNNGKQTKAIVIFNHNELNFEEINVGMNVAFSYCNVRKHKNTFCSIKNGNLNPLAHFHETICNK